MIGPHFSISASMKAFSCCGVPPEAWMFLEQFGRRLGFQVGVPGLVRAGRRGEIRERCRRCTAQMPDHWHRRLLRARRQRPRRRRAADQRDELAAPHGVTQLQRSRVKYSRCLERFRGVRRSKTNRRQRMKRVISDIYDIHVPVIYRSLALSHRGGRSRGDVPMIRKTVFNFAITAALGAAIALAPVVASDELRLVLASFRSSNRRPGYVRQIWRLSIVWSARTTNTRQVMDIRQTFMTT